MKEGDRKELERMEKLATELERNPLTKKFREEEAAVTLSKRKVAAEKIVTLQREAETLAPLQVEIDDGVEELTALNVKCRELEKQINARKYKLATERLGIEGEIKEQEKILYGCYNPVIDETIQFFRTTIDQLRGPGKISINRLGSEWNIFTLRKKVHVESNVEAIHEALCFVKSLLTRLKG